MDFGDILDKWEKQSGKESVRTGNSPIPGSEEKVNPIDSWIRANGIYDKDSDDNERPVSAQEKRRRLRNKRPDAELDIHGLTREEAWQALEFFFNESKKNELEKIMIIHGKGNHSAGESVLKRTVMDYIEHCTFAGESGRAKAALGGEGSTWVLLK